MRKTFTVPLAIALAFLIPAAAGCGDDDDDRTGESPARTLTAEPQPASSGAEAAVLWPAPPDPRDRTVAAGLRPERKEFLIHHAHAHLDVFVDGKPIAVPAAIGIDIDDPPNTLGQFFTEWRVRLSRSCVGEHCSPGPVSYTHLTLPTILRV